MVIVFTGVRGFENNVYVVFMFTYVIFTGDKPAAAAAATVVAATSTSTSFVSRMCGFEINVYVVLTGADDSPASATVAATAGTSTLFVSRMCGFKNNVYVV